jgi:hypothetical protein
MNRYPFNQYRYNYQDDEDMRPTLADVSDDPTDEEIEEAQAEEDLRLLNEAEDAEIRRGIR